MIWWIISIFVMLVIILIVCICNNSNEIKIKYISSDGRIYDSYTEWEWTNKNNRFSCDCQPCVRGLSSYCVETIKGTVEGCSGFIYGTPVSLQDRIYGWRCLKCI